MAINRKVTITEQQRNCAETGRGHVDAWDGMNDGGQHTHLRDADGAVQKISEVQRDGQAEVGAAHCNQGGVINRHLVNAKARRRLIGVAADDLAVTQAVYVTRVRLRAPVCTG